MRRAHATVALASIAVAAGGMAVGATASSTPRIEVMVVGRAKVLAKPKLVRAREGTVSLTAHRHCAVAAGTPLAALEARRRLRGPDFRLRDYGSCSRHPADSVSLFVTQIGSDRNHGSDGWVYKVGRRVPSVGAGDPDGRLRSGARLVWFYCRMQTGGSCQRTLEVTAAHARVSPGAAVRVTVRGYDDNGGGKPVAGAVAKLGGATATTAPDGTATLAAPTRLGSYRVAATAAGLVPAFGAVVVVR